MAAGTPSLHPRGPDGQAGRGRGRGPAGLACAHRLAMHGHDVTIFDGARQARRAERIRHRRLQDGRRFRRARGRLAAADRRDHRRDRPAAGRDLSLEALRRISTRCFLGLGLGGVNALGSTARRRTASRDAVEFIADLRQADDLSQPARGPRRCGDRRRHDGGRRRRAGPASGRAEREPRLSPGPRADECQPLRAGSRRLAGACGSSPTPCPWRSTATARCARSSSNIPTDDLTPRARRSACPPIRCSRPSARRSTGGGLPDRRGARSGHRRRAHHLDGVWAGGRLRGGRRRPDRGRGGRGPRCRRGHSRLLMACPGPDGLRRIRSGGRPSMERHG